jgi:hypothetical protein
MKEFKKINKILREYKKVTINITERKFKENACAHKKPSKKVEKH